MSRTPRRRRSRASCKERRAPRRDHARRRARARACTASPVLVEHGAGAGLVDHRRRLPRRRARRSWPTPTTCGRAPSSCCKVKEPQPEEFALPAARPRAVHLPPPRRVPRGRRRAARARRHRRRLRDGAARVGRAAAARADERGRGPHGAAGRRALPRARATAGAACCSAARPACGRRGSSCSAPATSGGTRRGSPQGMEAEVLLLDKNLDRLRWVDQIHKGRIMTLASNRRRGRARGRRGRPRDRRGARARRARAGRRHRRRWCASMRPGSVIVDVRRSTRAAASRTSTRRRTPTRSTSVTACCTTRSATSPARCRTRRPTR